MKRALIISKGLFDGLCLLIKRTVPIVVDFFVLTKILKIQKKTRFLLVVFIANILAILMWKTMFAGAVNVSFMKLLNRHESTKALMPAVYVVMFLKAIVCGFIRWLVYLIFLWKRSVARLTLAVVISSITIVIITFLLMLLLINVSFVNV